MLQTIALRTDAPPKPEVGDACNGCGICCAAERCPAGWLFLPGSGGPCPALVWSAEQTRYRCGLVLRPTDYVGWLPKRLDEAAKRWFARRIAVGEGCDCDAVEIHDKNSAPD